MAANREHKRNKTAENELTPENAPGARRCLSGFSDAAHWLSPRRVTAVGLCVTLVHRPNGFGFRISSSCSSVFHGWEGINANGLVLHVARVQHQPVVMLKFDVVGIRMCDTERSKQIAAKGPKAFLVSTRSRLKISNQIGLSGKCGLGRGKNANIWIRKFY